MPPIDYKNVFVQPITNIIFPNAVQLHVLRLDKLHPIVSGNKWFKLKHQLQDAIVKKNTSVATFGGAYSNHIVATAYACKMVGLQSIGIIRGDELKQLNNTLLTAKKYGMDLHFVTRALYDDKQLIQQTFNSKNCYWINEGGYSVLGADGVKEMYQWIDKSFTHIVSAVGTGTMMAGLIKGALPHQKVVGISVLKGHNNWQSEVENLLGQAEKSKQFELISDYHFGGYAKHPKALINWMNGLYQNHNLPTDIIYTSKLLYGIFDLIKQNHFPPNSKIMAIHSGGLQGNLSLPQGTFVFD